MDNNITNRQPWHVIAIIFGGLEFAIPVLIVGGVLAANFSLWETTLILLIGLVGIQWIGNSIVGYIGAHSGRGSSDLANLSLGKTQSKILVSFTIFIITLGWGAINTAVATDALCALLNIEKDNFLVYLAMTVVIGLPFAIPSIIGITSIKWVDYIAVPAGILLVITAIYLSVQNIGMEKITAWNPDSEMTILAGINLILGINVAQWLIAPDYTKMAKPKWKDNILIPLGIIGIGFPLFLVGAIMSVGAGEADIVKVMGDLGFPAWGFIALWLATWTSQMVNYYTGGIAMANIVNLNSEKSRKILTTILAVVCILLSSLGIMNYFIDFLYFLALLVPALAGVVMAHFFFFNNKESASSWNIKGTIGFAAGLLVGCLTQYYYPLGIPAVQSLLVAACVYWLSNKIG